MLFTRLSDDFRSLRFPGKPAHLPVALAQQLECIMQECARIGMLRGNESLYVSGDFGQQGHVCCVVHGDTPLMAIEIDGPNSYYFIFKPGASVKLCERQSGDFPAKNRR